MFGRRKEEAPKKRRGNGGGLSQYGLMDMDAGNDPQDDDGSDDGDLEAELMALTSGNARAKPKKVAAKPVPVVNLDSMIAASMREIPSDEELSGDDDDPDLLNELSSLAADEDESPSEPPPPPAARPPPSANSLVTLLRDRLKMYQQAEANAKTAGETTRARRFGRGIKTLNDLLKQASAGRVVNEEDIPPEVAITSTPTAAPVTTPDSAPTFTPDSAPATAPDSDPPTEIDSAPVVDQATLALLTERRDAYKRAALVAKKAGDNETALKYVKVAKQFDPVFAAVQAGQPVDLAQMPPPPPSVVTASEMPAATPQIEQAEQQTSEEPEPQPSERPEPEAPPPPPATVLEALEQRLVKYKSVQSAAQDEGNSSKARRIGRIVKQYEDALKLHRTGKPVPVEDLPTPPGFGPIPQEGTTAAPAAPAPVVPTPPRPAPAVPTPSRPAPAVPPPTRPAAVIPPSPATPEAAPKANVRKSPQSRQEKQLAVLTARQKEFKEAALEAKRNGEINQAKEYLRLSKGFDPLILATESGLPVDMDTVPVPPGTSTSLDMEFDLITAEDCLPGNDSEIFEKLEADLLKQAKMCLTTRDHFKAVGDVASANRFEQLAVHSKKDLDMLRFAHRRSEPVPKFHYETKTFSIVQCCTDLGDNDLELTIVQGINYMVPNPKDVDTYVKYEFPYPSENPPKDRTVLVKDTNNPVYNAVFPIPIQRNVRACQRVFKRQGIKLEVWSRGGFLRSDTLIGTVMVKLLPLETKCILHDSFDLVEGRRAIGGKLEVKVRLRNPIVVKQVEQVNEKWLIIDSLL